MKLFNWQKKDNVAKAFGISKSRNHCPHARVARDALGVRYCPDCWAYWQEGIGWIYEEDIAQALKTGKCPHPISSRTETNGLPYCAHCGKVKDHVGWRPVALEDLASGWAKPGAAATQPQTCCWKTDSSCWVTNCGNVLPRPSICTRPMAFCPWCGKHISLEK